MDEFVRRLKVIVLAIFSASCAGKDLSYEEAKKIAGLHEEIYKTSVNENPLFLDCLVAKVEIAEELCFENNDIYDDYSIILEFNKDGQVINTYARDKNLQNKCMSERMMGRLCANPPGNHLFGELQKVSEEESECNEPCIPPAHP